MSDEYGKRRRDELDALGDECERCMASDNTIYDEKWRLRLGIQEAVRRCMQKGATNSEIEAVLTPYLVLK